MEDRRTKLLPKIILGQLAVTALIAAIGLSVLFYAEGYRINTKTFKISKAGGLSLVSYPKKADVYINGVYMKDKTPYSSMLVPETYNIEVKKDGYNTWSRTVDIEPGLVSNNQNIVMFKLNPEIVETTDPSYIDLVNSPSNALANPDGLYYTNYEIWVKQDLITRFSKMIYKAIWYTDQKHVIYQQGNQIHVIEITGKNDVVLVTLKSDTRTNFAMNNRGDELYFLDGGKYYAARIR